MRNISKKTLVLALGMFFTFTQAVDAIVENDPADKISKAAWTINQEVKLTKAEEITKTAWSYESEEDQKLIALAPEAPTAYAADLEDADPADKVTKNAWSTNQEAKLTKAEEITKTAWSYMAEEEKTLVALNQNNQTAFAADLESDDPTDTITKAIWMK